MVTGVTTITGEPFLLAIRYIYVNDLPSTTAMYLLLLLLLYLIIISKAPSQIMLMYAWLTANNK